MTSSFLNFLTLVLWFNVEPVLENTPRALEKHGILLLLDGEFYSCLFSLQFTVLFAFYFLTVLLSNFSIT